jgi:radical SAM superfamily enzyme YgiQ (UPF0313 family)
LADTPPPMWSLLKLRRYASMSLQYSRGCPFHCEFCDITTLFGHKVRTKSSAQILAELQNLYDAGWRGSLFMVDDNFIGNKAKLKREVLPAMIQWMREHKHPFILSTETSIDLSDDTQLMTLMAQAGFEAVFVGIESPSEESLAECGKLQNRNRDLVASIKKIQSFGLEVNGGFIVGFDHDSPSVFKKQIELIQNSRIITAMVGLLNAPRGSKLYQRIVQEGRLLAETTGTTPIFPPTSNLKWAWRPCRRATGRSSTAFIPQNPTMSGCAPFCGSTVPQTTTDCTFISDTCVCTPATPWPFPSPCSYWA